MTCTASPLRATSTRTSGLSLPSREPRREVVRTQCVQRKEAWHKTEDVSCRPPKNNKLAAHKSASSLQLFSEQRHPPSHKGNKTGGCTPREQAQTGQHASNTREPLRRCAVTTLPSQKQPPGRFVYCHTTTTNAHGSRPMRAAATIQHTLTHSYTHPRTHTRECRQIRTQAMQQHTTTPRGSTSVGEGGVAASRTTTKLQARKALPGPPRAYANAPSPPMPPSTRQRGCAWRASPAIARPMPPASPPVPSAARACVCRQSTHGGPHRVAGA